MSRITLGTLICLGFTIMGCGDSAGGVDIWDAVENDDAVAVQAYAEAGGDLNVRKFNDSTPLWVALNEKKQAAYEALLKHGADPNIIMSGKRVVTHWAASEDGPGWLRLALENGADPNLLNVGRGIPNTGTPFHYAITESSLKNIKLLVEHGADVNKLNHVNAHSLARAAAQNDFEIVLYLLNHGAEYKNENARSSGMLFPEIIDQKWENISVFRLKKDRDGLTAVHAWLEERE